MDQKKRFHKLRKKWKELGVEDLNDDKLDEYQQELKKCRGWNRKSGRMQRKVAKILKKYNDRLEKLLKERDAL
ncbi:hypothetical protein KGY79_11630 [Candidatus Bipolaricaulota bacterium]|nr:hypothetical protein [Candidatus Bipolaricaulota bacterium]